MNNNELTIIQEKTFETISRAVDKMVNLIRPTYGPAGNKVIIKKVTHQMVVDDGVQIARDFELPDPAENAVVNVIREVAVKTNDRVGDGTTSSLIMLQAIFNEISRRSRKDGRSIAIELKAGLEDVRASLKKSAKPIRTKDELLKVARVSFDDPKIAEMIADLYVKMGADATITIDRSPTMETTCETSDGIKIDKGYISQYMVINPERMETVFEKPYILLTDYRLTEAADLLPLLNLMAKEGKQGLVIIAENVEQGALATLIINHPNVFNNQTKKQGTILSVAINAPSGEHRKVALEDMALMTGARFFSESKGDKLETVTLADLGRAERFICRRDESIIVSPKGKKADITKAINQLKQAASNEKDEKRKSELLKRVSTMTNTVAVIRVGAATENEQRALKYKVEDAVNAVKVAYKGGVVCGSGLSLARLTTSSAILNQALKAPHRQLCDNMGLPETSDLKSDEALNVVSGKKGKFMDVGVVDPVDVLIAGVESAVSIASLLITSSGMIVESPKKSPTEGQN